MKRRSIFLIPLLSAGILFGCADQTAKHNQDVEANANMRAISLSGDFKGPLGLQLWSLREYTKDDVAAALAKTHDMGFREVELAGTYGMTPAAYRKMLDDAGLTATAMHTGYERFRDSLEVVLNEAQTLGVKYLGVAWIPHERGKPFTDAMARAAAMDFDKWGKAAKQRGLQFFYHVHGYEFKPDRNGRTPFDVLAASTDPDAVKYEMDVFWVTRSGTDPASLLRKYPNRWALMHIKDMKDGTPTGDYSGGAPAEADVPVGTGQIDYEAVLKAAQEIGLAKYYIEDESTDPLGGIPKSVTYLEGVTFQ